MISPCVADRYAQQGERIIEVAFNGSDGAGALISLRRHVYTGAPILEVYRCEGVEVRAPARNDLDAALEGLHPEELRALGYMIELAEDDTDEYENDVRGGGIDDPEAPESLRNRREDIALARAALARLAGRTQDLDDHDGTVGTAS